MVELEVIHHLFESLVAMDGSYNAKAGGWPPRVDIDPDAKRFALHLARGGFKFHTGKTVTSADVLASFRTLQSASARNAEALADVERFEAPDPDHFVVHLKKPNAVFVDVLKTPRLPVSRSCRPTRRTRPEREVDIVGNGAVFARRMGQGQPPGDQALRWLRRGMPGAPGPDGAGGASAPPISTRCATTSYRRPMRASPPCKLATPNVVGDIPPRIGQALREPARARAGQDHSVLHAGLRRAHPAGADRQSADPPGRSRPWSTSTRS